MNNSNNRQYILPPSLIDCMFCIKDPPELGMQIDLL